MGFRGVWGSGFGVGVWGWGSGFKVYRSSGFKVYRGLGFKVWGLGLGFGV